MIRWASFALYTLSIYLILPFSRGWQIFLREALGKNFSLSTNLLLMFAALLTVLWLASRLARRSLVSLLGMLIVSYILVMQIDIPEERIHILQYGILGYLAALSVFQTLKGITAFAVVLLLGLFIGFGDEVIQGLLPTRVFDWWDVIYNFFGVLLGTFIYRVTV